MENITQIWKKIQSPEFNPATDMGLVEQVKQVALTSQEPAKVSFGTSGWRGEIGSEFTLRNLQVVGAAIVRLYKEATPELFEALGVRDQFEPFSGDETPVGFRLVLRGRNPVVDPE